MSQDKNKFETLYNRLCEQTGSVLSIYHIEFPLRITINELEGSSNYSPIYLDHVITNTNKQNRVSIYKNISNIYLYLEESNFTSIKLLFDARLINRKDLDLLIINLKKQSKNNT
jgi:hypothetical protein